MRTRNKTALVALPLFLCGLSARADNVVVVTKPLDFKLPQCTKSAIWSAKPRPQTAIAGATAQLADLDKYTAGDRDPKLCVHYLVIHEGATKDTIKSFVSANQKGKPEDVRSTHFVITRAGALIQAADLRRVAWHARNISFWSIGVDLEIPDGCDQSGACVASTDCSKKCTYTQEQYKALDGLITSLSGQTSILRDDAHVINHCQVFGNGHGDTRNLDWSRLRLTSDAHREGNNPVNGRCKRAFDETTFQNLVDRGFPIQLSIPVVTVEAAKKK